MIYLEAALKTPRADTFVTEAVSELTLDLGGIPGDRHYGMTAKADVRFSMYPRGTEIRNRRQLSAVSCEELVLVARELGLAEVRAEWLGANLLFRGLPDLTLFRTGARLLFPSGAGLICEGENEPCRGPGEVIRQTVGGAPGLPAAFVKAAQHRRGIVLSVERAGLIRAGDQVKVEA